MESPKKYELLSGARSGYFEDLVAAQSSFRSLLDWEDASLADGRFELLLLCRKVVAGLGQARRVWGRYGELTGRDIGRLEPWRESLPTGNAERTEEARNAT